jgi:hypothetical protein
MLSVIGIWGLSLCCANALHYRIQGWSVDQVIGHLQNVRPELTRAVFLTLQREYAGHAFLDLMEEKLISHPYNMAAGLASVIASYVQEVNGMYPTCSFALQHHL